MRNAAEIDKNKKRKNGEKKRDKRRIKSANVEENQEIEIRVSQLPRGLYPLLIFLKSTSFLLMPKHNSKDKVLQKSIKQI